MQTRLLVFHRRMLKPPQTHMGAFDVPTETHAELHVFVAEKGDYYEIGDGLPQYQRIP